MVCRQFVEAAEHVESYGIKLDMVPFALSSHIISQVEMPHITLGRVRNETRRFTKSVDDCNTAKAGIPALKYNMSPWRYSHGADSGRGGSSYSTFVYDKAVKTRLTEAAG